MGAGVYAAAGGINHGGFAAVNAACGSVARPSLPLSTNQV